MADLLLRAGRIEEAEPLHRSVAEDYAQRLGPQHDLTSFAYARVAVIRILEGDAMAGTTFLDRLHGYMEEQKVNGGGRFSADHHDLLEQFTLLLEDTGPPDELDRFSALLEGEQTGR